MMRQLILTRHAKSGWDNPVLTDHARKLAPRGQRAAPRVGRWLAAQGFIPAEALVSDATRTRETWALLAAELGAPVPTRFIPDLYHASPETMLQVLRSARAQTVIMVGHNPGIAEFAQALVQTRPAHPQFARYPSGATLVAEFDLADWNTLRPGTGTVAAFIVPRELDTDPDRDA